VQLGFHRFQGSHLEVGRAHGETLRDGICTIIERWSDVLCEMHGRGLAELSEAAIGAGFLEAANRLVPHLVDEVRGIGEGANLSFQVAFGWQLLDELEWLGEGAEALPRNRCSTLGASGTRGTPTVLGQNADMGRSFDGVGVVLHLVDTSSGRQTLTVTPPGVVGLYGLNSDSVGLCLNAMDIPSNRRTDGLATSLIARGVLDQPSVAAAEVFLRRVTHATGECYTVGDRSEVRAFECSARTVRRLTDWPERELTCHTNHPVYDLSAVPSANSIARLDTLADHLAALRGPIGVSDIITALSSHSHPEHPICRHHQDGSDALTTLSLAMELSSTPRLTACLGRPCNARFSTFGLEATPD
jgi:isopenicillin-N N-acyltransferase like protein